MPTPEKLFSEGYSLQGSDIKTKEDRETIHQKDGERFQSEILEPREIVQTQKI